MADVALKAPEEKTPDLASLKKMFEESASLTKDARDEAFKARDYFDGVQWTREEKAALARRKQPDNVFNRVRPAIEGTVGVIEQGQTDPKAWPKNPEDEDGAEVATKILRYIEDASDFDGTKTEAAHEFYIEGICAAIVEVDEDREVLVTQIRYEEFFYDPRSRRKDFSDARYMGIAKWRYADEVAADFPDQKDNIDRAMEGAVSAIDETYGDRPTSTSAVVAWVDKNKRRLMQVELYHLENREWRRCVFYSGGVLSYGPSPYLDEKRRTRNPIISAACYIDRENNRYGKVRDMRGPQDEINKRRSKGLWRASTSQVQAVDPAAIEVSADTARAEAARPDGVIPFGWQRVTDRGEFAQEMQLLQEAKAEIERMGPNPAILGRQGETQSGRAQLVRQQAGLTELSPSLGTFDRWVKRIYEAMWMCARQFWDAPKWIRITDDEKSVQFIGLNMPMTQDGLVAGQDGMPIAGPNGQPVRGAHMPQLNVDIDIETTPDTATLDQEQFQSLVDLKKAGVSTIPDIALIKASSLPKKREVLDEIEKAAQQPPNPGQQLAMAQGAADVKKTEADATLSGAKARNEAMKPQLDVLKLGIEHGSQPAAGVQSGVPGAQPV